MWRNPAANIYPFSKLGSCSPESDPPKIPPTYLSCSYVDSGFLCTESQNFSPLPSFHSPQEANSPGSCSVSASPPSQSSNYLFVQLSLTGDSKGVPDEIWEEHWEWVMGRQEFQVGSRHDWVKDRRGKWIPPYCYCFFWVQWVSWSTWQAGKGLTFIK